MGRPRVLPLKHRITARPPLDRAVKSAGRTLEILEFFDDIQRRSTVTEVAQALGYPQSSASALLRSLVVMGYLHFDLRSRTYITSSRVALLGSWVSTEFFAEGAVISMMKELSERTGDTVMLATRNDLNIQYIHVIQAKKPARLHLTLGTVRPLAQSGAGYAAMSALSDREVALIVKRINAEAQDGQPLIRLQELISVLADVRHKGYAFSCDVITPGGGIIAAPLLTGPGAPLMVVGIGGISELMRQNEAELAYVLKDTMQRHVKNLR